MPDYEILNGLGHRPGPEERTYQPASEPAAPFQPPSVTASARQFKGTTFEQAHAAMIHAQNEYQRVIASINDNKHHYTEAGYKAQIDKFQSTDAFQAVTQHVAQVDDRREQARQRVGKVRAELSPDGDTAAELRATRYWNRAKGILDATKEPSQIITRARELIQQANPTELGTLLQELEPYCLSRGATTEWIDPAIGQAAPQYAAAKNELRKAEQAVAMTRANANMLTRAITSRSHVPIALSTPRRAGDYDPDK